MRSPHVTRSSSSTSANGACRPPSVEAWARPAHPVHQAHQAQLLVPRLRLHSFWQSSIHARPPGTRLQTSVGRPPPRSPSRRLQIVVRRGQRWWRQMPRGSSTRSSPRWMARRVQCPRSVRRMQVSRARPSRIAAVSNRVVDGSLFQHHHRARCIHLAIHPAPHLISRLITPLARLRCPGSPLPTRHHCSLLAAVFSLDPSLSVRIWRGDPSGDGAPA